MSRLLLVLLSVVGLSSRATARDTDIWATRVATSLDTLDSTRSEMVLAVMEGRRADMVEVAKRRARALETLHDAAANKDLLRTLSPPEITRWLSGALVERQPDWSRSLLQAGAASIGPPGSPDRGPLALVVGLNALRLLEREGHPENPRGKRTGSQRLQEIAVDALSTAAQEPFILQDEARFQLWKLALSDADTLTARAWADSLAIRHPRSLRTPRVRSTRARAWLDRGEPARALEEARLAPPTWDSVELRWVKTQALAQLEFAREEARELEQLITDFGTEPLAVSAWKRRQALGRTIPTLTLGPRREITLLVSLLPQPESGSRERLLAIFEDTGLEGPVRAEAGLKLGRFLYARRRYGEAEPLLNRLADGTHREAADEAHLLLARIYRNRGRLKPMAQHYRKLTTGDGELVSVALWELARELESQARWGDAVRVYTELIDRFPRGHYARNATFRRGFDHTRMEEWEASAADFQSAYRASGSDTDREQAAYWLARVRQAQGRPEEAEAAMRSALTTPEPAGFYGVLIRERLGLEPGVEDKGHSVGGFRIDLRSPEELHQWPEPIRAYYERGLALAKMGDPEAARQEWKRASQLGSGIPTLFQALSAAATAHNIYPEGVRWAERADTLLPTPNAFGNGFQRLSYPMAYYGDVMLHSRRQGVEPITIWAIMRQESFYDPLAISRAGAMGLLQIMPATLRRMTREGGSPHLPVESLFIPEVNIALGTRFFSERLDEFGDRLLPTLASYNAGEAKSWEWLERADQHAEEVFLECVGYPETYGYLRRVRWLIWVYQAYYDGVSPPRSESREAR